MPLVTIIIPVYNTEKYLKECLNSVINQTYKNTEIIIINDASTDNSLTIIKKFIDSRFNIRLINHSKNLGVSISRNKGLDLANGEYIYFLDSDDFIRFDTIEKMITLAIDYNVALVEANYKKILINHKNIFKNKNTSVLINIEENKDFIQNHLGMVWNKLYKKELIDKLRFPKNLRYEDNAFIYPLLTKVNKVVITTEILYFYRIHFQGFMLKNSFIPNSVILDLYKITDLIKKQCLKYGTYEKYKENINYIMQEKIFDTILQISTWIKISKTDKMKIISNLYLYNKKQYKMPEIKQTNYIENRLSKFKFIAKIKKYWILHFIKKEFTLNNKEENYLDFVKNILSKYER